MKNIFIVGSRGYHYNYGGWETFVTNLVDNYNDSNTIFYISKITTNNEDVKSINDNITLFPIKVSNFNGLNMFKYAIKSLNKTIEYIEKNNINNAIPDKIDILTIRLSFLVASCLLSDISLVIANTSSKLSAG